MCSPIHKGITTCRCPHLPVILHYLSTKLKQKLVRGSRPLPDLTRHLTTRTDDSHATPDYILFETIIKIESKVSNIILYISKYKLEL